MSTRHLFVSGDISVLEETLDLACSEYKYLYVSLGGKYNQPLVSFHNPAYLSSNQYQTNASFQMIPAFLRQRPSDSRVLVVVVDEYETDQIREANQHIVDQLCSQFLHIDVVLYHKKLHLDDVPRIANVFVRFAQSRAIAPSQCMFCNFIRFRGCLCIDVAQLEAEIPRIFQKTLDSETITGGAYAGCLYQWFGYQFYVYHLVYSYKHYDMKRHLSVLRLLTECSNSIPLGSSNAGQLFMADHAKLPPNKRVLLGLMDTAVDLLSPANNVHRICSSLLEFCGKHTQEPVVV